MADCYHGDQIRCYAYIVDDSNCVRTNTISAYTETNRQVSKDIFCWVYFNPLYSGDTSLPLIQEWQFSVSGKRLCKNIG